MSLLESVLTMVPPNFTPDAFNKFLTQKVVKDVLTKRTNFRRDSKSGSAANPKLAAPVSGEWLGTCNDCRTHDDKQKIKYCLSFKPCGTVDGKGSTPAGDFIVKGVYALDTGTVAWRQSPLRDRLTGNSEMIAEFVGTFSPANWPSQCRTIVGSFLTFGGDYFSVNLQDPELQPLCAKLPSALPTLLTAGTCTPKGADTLTHFSSKNSNPSHVAENESQLEQGSLIKKKAKWNILAQRLAKRWPALE